MWDVCYNPASESSSAIVVDLQLLATIYDLSVTLGYVNIASLTNVFVACAHKICSHG